jgi:2-phosphosulfolactate phosphatase
MPRIHVLLTKQELDSVRLPGKVVVVVDILFATSSIVTALAHGAKEVIPAIDEAAARTEASRYASGTYVLSGELNVETLPGFVPSTPLRLLQEDLAGKTLIYSTTNGTVALRKSESATRVYAGALLNGEAVTEHLAREFRNNTVLIACSGSGDNFNLEDCYGAGYFVDLLAERYGSAAECSDAALAARRLFRSGEAADCMLSTRVGRFMVERGLVDEVLFAAKLSTFDVVPILVNGSVRLDAAESVPGTKPAWPAARDG